MNVKKIGAAAALASAMALTAVGFGAGLANAEQFAPDSPGITWKLDRHGDHWDHDGWRGPGWNAPAYWDGPVNNGCAWVPPAVSMWVPPAVC